MHVVSLVLKTKRQKDLYTGDKHQQQRGSGTKKGRGLTKRCGAKQAKTSGDEGSIKKK